MAGSPNAPVKTIEYRFDPAQVVWIIQGCGENSVVVQATVVRVIGVVTVADTPGTVTYTVNLVSSSATTSLTVDEADMFDTLTEAVAEYETRLSA